MPIEMPESDVPVVYFIVSDECAKVKIGKSRDLISRFTTIKMYSPTPVRVYGYVTTQSDYAAFALESKLHKDLDAHYSHGEWFHFNDKVKEVIDLVINTVSANPVKPASLDLLDNQEEEEEFVSSEQSLLSQVYTDHLIY